ncbi:MAG: hypothetical protein JJD96_02930 [Thermoleophilia bacterium]|nr:hypothetical protein [Thermoleophilia bacterium]
MAHQSRLLLVLLGLLAIWIAHVSQASAAPNDDWIFAEPFSIVTNAANQDKPTADGDIVAWRDYPNSSLVPYLYGKNLSSGSEQQLSTYSLSKYMSYMDMKGGTLTYQTSSGSWLLCTRNLALDPANLTAAPENCIATSTAYGISISQSGNRVIFDGQEYTNGIRVADFDTGQVGVLDTNTYGTNSPYANRDMGFWQSQMSFEGRYYEYVIMKRPLDGSLPVNNVTGRGCADGPPTTIVRAHPRAAGDMVVFARKNNSNGVITDYNIAIPTVAPDDDDRDLRCNDPLVVDEPYDQQNPEITEINVDGVNHHLVVWEDNRNGNWDVYAKDLENNQEVPICVCPGDQRFPDVTVDSSGKPFIVWQDSRNGNWDIYGAKATRAQELAERYAPELHFRHDINRSDRNDFEPRTVDLMVDGAEKLLTTGGDIFFPSLQALVDNPGPDNYLDLPGSPANPFDNYIDSYLAQIQEQPQKYDITAYARVVPKAEGSDKTVIQYWLNYYYNNWHNNHEGDWEMVEVILNENVEPEAVAYSQHGAAFKKNWNEAGFKKTDTHPKVFVAEGSHANYFFEASILHFLDAATPWGLRDRTGSASSTMPTMDMNGLDGGWADFAGRWGEVEKWWWPPLITEAGPKGPAFQGDSWNLPLTWAASSGLIGYLNDFILSAHSPVEIHLYDPQGNHVGKNAQGGFDMQIPGSEYFERSEGHSKNIVVHNADVLSNYTVKIEGTGTGTMDLEIQSPDFGGNVVDKPLYLAVKVSPSMKAELSVTSAKDYNLKLDSDGDGAFEQLRSPDVTQSTATDFTPPAAITDIAVTNTTSGNATLIWTAPGDDGIQGTAYKYDFRYSTDPITEDNWQYAKTAGSLPDPQAAGSEETATVTGLNAGITDYFAVKARDDAWQESALSNVASESTTIPNLTWAKQKVNWANWTDYQNRQLSIDYRLGNAGTGGPLLPQFRLPLPRPILSTP